MSRQLDETQPPAAVIYGCAGPEMTSAEAAFFADARPLGFILFERNCRTPEQTRALTTALRATIDRPDAPILIDQEGGRVARLGPPHWRRFPPAGRFSALAADPEAQQEAVRLNARLMARELREIGVTVNCAPVVDLRFPDAHEIVGDRAYGSTPEAVIACGRAVADGLLLEGVLPVIKHVPGHGRALVDSHLEKPRVTTSRKTLEETDFLPFRALADLPWAMTAHVDYKDIDDRNVATLSATIIGSVIRDWMGFDGVLVSDDLSMKALDGPIGERGLACLEAGCDVALHCNGDMAEMEAIAARMRPLDPAAVRRISAAESRRQAAAGVSTAAAGAAPGAAPGAVDDDRPEQMAARLEDLFRLKGQQA